MKHISYYDLAEERKKELKSKTNYQSFSSCLFFTTQIDAEPSFIEFAKG
jgi:hypothetical protein